MLWTSADMSFAAGAFSSGLRRGGGGGGGGGGDDGGPRRLFNRIKDGKDGKFQDGKDSSGPSPIMSKLMMNAMVAMSPGGNNATDGAGGSANKDHAKDGDPQLNDIDKKHEMDRG